MTKQMLKPDWMGWRETRDLMAVFAKHKTDVRFVGGSVRDALLNKPVQDLDLATSLKPEAVIAELTAHGVTAVPTGLKHGTVTAVIAGRHFEITTLRRDTHCDGRHAKVEFTDNWEEDAKRRDFTMNALYLTFEGELVDYVGGAEDALIGVVRFIGDAGARIQEDYLRILRFFRFYAHYCKTPADKTAMEACTRHAHGIKTLAGERIRHEMFKLFSAADPLPALALMQKAKLIEVVFGAAAFKHDALARLLNAEQTLKCAAETETRLATALPEAALPVLAERWKLPNAAHEVMQSLYKHAPDVAQAVGDTAKQKKLLRKLGAAHFRQLVLMAYASKDDLPNAANYTAMLNLAGSWVPPEFPLSGKDLKAEGFSEGREMGEILRRLEMTWEESDYQLNKQALLKLAGKP